MSDEKVEVEKLDDKTVEQMKAAGIPELIEVTAPAVYLLSGTGYMTDDKDAKTLADSLAVAKQDGKMLKIVSRGSNIYVNPKLVTEVFSSKHKIPAEQEDLSDVEWDGVAVQLLNGNSYLSTDKDLEEVVSTFEEAQEVGSNTIGLSHEELGMIYLNTETIASFAMGKMK